MDLQLEGHVVLVTGGSAGLGRALCERLAAEGASVGFCGRDGARVAELADTLRGGGGDVAGTVADVSDPGDIARFVGDAVERWGRLDGLVNNAGQSAAAKVEDTDDDVWDDDLRLKLYAAVRTTRAALPHLRRRGGAIVNTLAIAAKAPGAASSPSSVSRAAGMALTKELSKELGPDGIRVNAVLVGLVESGQWERLAGRTGTPIGELYERMIERAGVPLGRVGRAEEYADLVTFLLSPRAAYLTGTAINLDGGASPVV